MNLANKVGLWWLMFRNVSEEMPTTSQRNQRLNEDWTKGLSRGPTREYTFIASPHDWQVTNYDSSLMEVDDQIARYALVLNHGHNSIVDAVAQSVAEIIFTQRHLNALTLDFFWCTMARFLIHKQGFLRYVYPYAHIPLHKL